MNVLGAVLQACPYPPGQSSGQCRRGTAIAITVSMLHTCRAVHGCVCVRAGEGRAVEDLAPHLRPFRLLLCPAAHEKGSGGITSQALPNALTCDEMHHPC
jgi:hypothetical protein